ncbi:MAG: hypothetical protein CM15mP49_07770 [Actinomycetota bacterium]|nr:MAG: hypothetical protein CM15mP49_07770 [Actinomycetota bacterium]
MTNRFAAWFLLGCGSFLLTETLADKLALDASLKALRR